MKYSTLKHKYLILVEHFFKRDKVLRVWDVTKGYIHGKRHISSQTEQITFLQMGKEPAFQCVLQRKKIQE